MKSIKFKMAFVLAGLMFSFSACKKEAPNIYNMFNDVSVTFSADHEYSIVDYKQVNDGDSIYINYTITSAKEDMSAVCIKWEGQDPPVAQINLTDGDNKRSYTGVYKMRADRAGDSKYRVYALNKQAAYIGDGYKSVTFNVKPDFTFTTNRRIYVPVTETNDVESFYSIKRAKSFSYLNGQTASADIDFGIYATVAPEGDRNATLGLWFHIYSLSADPLPFGSHDFSSWTKRATLFSGQFGEAATFNSNKLTGNLLSSVNIEKQAKTKTINLKETPKTSGGAIKPGSVVYFKTPEGKYGAILFETMSRDENEKLFVVVNVKVQN